MRIPLVISMLMFSGALLSQEKCDCDSTLSFVYKKWDVINNMSYHSKKTERKIDEYEIAEFDFLVQRKPFKVAGLMTDKGHRLLYDPVINPSEALYISSGFPYTNLWLDIHGKVFRGLNHYTISNAGCEFIFGIIRNEYNRMPEDFRCVKTTFKGNSCIELSAMTNDFKYKPYKALKGETVLDIAKKFNVLAYLLIEKNDNVSEYNEDLGGEEILVPSRYGAKVKLVVNATHGMPHLIEVFDDIGLVQRYEYTNYEFNQVLPKDYFTEEFQDDLD